MAIAEITVDNAAKLFAQQIRRHIQERIREETVRAIDEARDKVIEELSPSIRAYAEQLLVQTDLVKIIDLDRIVMHIKIDGVEK